MEHSLEEIRHILKKYGQEHLLSFYNNIQDANRKEKFLKQIKEIDYELISSLYNQNENVKKDKDRIEPIDFIDKYKLNGDYKYYEEIGRKSLKNGELAVVTMAGGQGTRLGHKGPKGTFDIGLDSHKCLFELLCDNLKEKNKKYGITIPWFIMTSKENNQETIDFFEKNKFFGYQKDKNLFFFMQGELPMVDTQGKILINEDGFIKFAANGHGGVYEALVKNNMTNKMRELGAKWVFIGGVDNCLAKMTDEVFLGLTIDKGVCSASKSVVKVGPKEKVGVFCKKNGKPSIIEYIDINEEMATAVDKDGEFLYGESNILAHLFNIDSIEKMGSAVLPYHAAYKKAKYIDENGNLIEPTSPNAYKFEAFMFEAFNEIEDMIVLRVKREEEFAPVKNADGVDSPETARKLYNNFYKLS